VAYAIGRVLYFVGKVRVAGRCVCFARCIKYSTKIVICASYIWVILGITFVIKILAFAITIVIKLRATFTAKLQTKNTRKNSA
jgi:hypothetical protein